MSDHKPGCWQTAGCTECGARAGEPCRPDCPDGGADEFCCHAPDLRPNEENEMGACKECGGPVTEELSDFCEPCSDDIDRMVRGWWEDDVAEGLA